MNVSLTKEQEELINKKIASGRYSSPGEVIQEALQALDERDHLDEIRAKELKKEIAIGIEQAESGRVKPFNVEDIKRRVRERSAKG